MTLSEPGSSEPGSSDLGSGGSPPTAAPSRGWQPPRLGRGRAAEPVPEPIRPPEPVRSESEEARQHARDEGFAEGLAAGRAQAEAIVGELNTLLAATVTPFQEADAGLVCELVALVERIARSVVGQELAAGRYDLEGTIAAAMSVLGSARVPVELRLNPKDAALCREHGLLSEREVSVQPDPSLGRGALRLKAGAMLVDAGIEARLAQVLTTLRDEAGMPGASEPESGADGEAAQAAGTGIAPGPEVARAQGPLSDPAKASRGT